MFGSVFNKKFDLSGELAELHKEISAITDVKQMAATPGWVKLRGLMVDKVVSYDSSIVTLSGNVKKHADEITYKHALRSALREFVSAVDKTVDVEEEVQKRIKTLEETARAAGLVRDTLS